MAQTFKLKYDPKFEVGDFTKAEADGAGLTDALVFGSMLFPPDGSFSAAVFGVDGRTGEGLEPVDVFRFWVALASQLAADEELPPAYRTIARVALEDTRHALGIVPAPPPHS